MPGSIETGKNVSVISKIEAVAGNSRWMQGQSEGMNVEICFVDGK
jgi:hypothetical protein